MTSLNLLQSGELDSAFITDLQVDTISSYTNPSISILSPLDFTIVPTIQSNTLESFVRQQISTTGALTYNNLNGLITGLTIDTTNSVNIDLSITNDTLLSANLSQTFLNRIDGLSGDIDILINETKFFTGNGLNDVLMTTTGNLLISGTILTNNLVASGDLISVNLIVSSNATFNNLFSTNILSTNGTFTNLHSNNLDANKATFNNLFSSNIDANNIESNKATFNNLFSSNIDANNIESNKATFNNLYSTNIEANKATFTQLNSNRLIINSNATFGSNISTTSLFVANNCNIFGNLAANSVSISSNLTITGLTRNNTLIVSGNATFNSNVSINTISTTNLSLNGNLLVNSNATFSNNIATSGLSVSNNCNILGNLVANSVSISSNLVANSVSISSNLVANSVSISSTLTITGLTRLNTLIVSGNTTFNSNVSVLTLQTTNLSLNGNLSVLGSATFGSPINVSGSIRLNGGVEYSDSTVLVGRGNNGLNFRTNNLTRMVISQNGNIGIGLDNPQTKLDISGRARINSLSSGDTSAVLEFRPANGTTNFLFVNNSNNMVATPANFFCNGLNALGSNSNLAVNGNLFLEVANGSNTVFLDFHSTTASVQDFDGRIRCVNGTSGTSQRGNLSYLANDHTFETPAADKVVIDNKTNMGVGITAPRARLDVRMSDGVGGDSNPSMIIDNSATDNNTVKGVLLQFRGSDTVGTNKDLGGIRYTPNDSNYVNGSTLIRGRRSNGVLTSLQINHATQETIFTPNGGTGFNPSIYLNGRTNSGEQGVRIHYDATTNNAGGARFDLKANIGSQTMRFRANTSDGLTDMMVLEQGGNCIIANNCVVGGTLAVSGSVGINGLCDCNNLPATGVVDVFHNGGILGVQASDIRTKTDVESYDYELEELWKTIKPIKYFYKTKISNQINESGKYRKSYGINATILHKNLKQIIANQKVELCEYCQMKSADREEGLECECYKFETIQMANYCSRDIISICISKINKLETDLVKERIAYKLEKDKKDRQFKELSLTITQLMGKLRLSGIKC